MIKIFFRKLCLVLFILNKCVKQTSKQTHIDIVIDRWFLLSFILVSDDFWVSELMFSVLLCWCLLSTSMVLSLQSHRSRDIKCRFSSKLVNVCWLFPGKISWKKAAALKTLEESVMLTGNFTLQSKSWAFRNMLFCLQFWYLLHFMVSSSSTAKAIARMLVV